MFVSERECVCVCFFVCVCVCLCSHLATIVVIINIDREAERKRKREAEDKEGHTGWYSNPAGAATSKATIFKEGIGKYIADDKGKSAVVAAPLTMGGDKGKAAEKISISATAADDDDDIWANVVPVKKVKVQPKAGFGDFSGW